jgi:ABC-type branched-subunit amino acid transport system substrate-binding protein
VAATADELGLPTLTFSPTLPLVEESEWIFRDMLTNEAVAKELARFLVEDKGLRRVAILHPEMPYGVEMKELFEAALLERGGEIRRVETYAQDATSFSEPVKKLVGRFDVEQHPEYYQRLGEIRAQNLDARRRRNAIERMRQSLSPQVDFDVIFLPDQWRTVSLVAPALAFEDVVTSWCDDWEIKKARKTTGHRVQPVLLLGVNLWNHPELPVRGGKYLQCSMFVDGWFQQSEREATAAFVRSFQARQGRAPGMLEAYAAEAGTVLRAVMEGARPKTRRELRDRLAVAEGIPGPMGPASVNEKGEVVHDLYLLSIDEGAIREGEPGQRDDEEEAIP